MTLRRDGVSSLRTAGYSLSLHGSNDLEAEVIGRQIVADELGLSLHGSNDLEAASGRHIYFTEVKGLSLHGSNDLEAESLSR